MSVKFKFLFLVLFLLLTGCKSAPDLDAASTEVAEAIFATQTALAPTATVTNTPTPTASPTLTPTHTLTPLPTISPPPDPSAGNANIYGRVLWQGEPFAGLGIWLSGSSTDSGWVSEGAISDENGVFLFANIPPGDDYDFRGRIEKIDFPAGQVGVIELTIAVAPDENYNLGEYYLLPTDLVLLSPTRGSKISDSNPSLSWEPYPGAAYYHLELEQSLGNYTNMELDTEETQVDIELPLMACIYGWDITAYSETGIPLAKTDAEFVDDPFSFYERFDGLFTIESDALPSCFINLIYPPNYAKLSVTEGNSGFLWEAHPLATSYHIRVDRIRDASGNLDVKISIISETIEVTEDGSFTTADLPWLARGQYNWRVTAYRDGVTIAASSGFRNPWRFTIE